MTVKCLDCGYVDGHNTIKRINRYLTFASGREAPFKCLRCGSRNIVSPEKEQGSSCF